MILIIRDLTGLGPRWANQVARYDYVRPLLSVDPVPAGFYLLRVDTKRNHSAKPNWLWLTGASTPYLEIDVRRKSERNAGNKGYSKPKG